MLLILPTSILAAVVGCNPKQETKQVTFEHPALRKGKMRAWSDDDVLIFEKADAEESFLIMVNVRNELSPKNPIIIKSQGKIIMLWDLFCIFAADLIRYVNYD